MSRHMLGADGFLYLETLEAWAIHLSGVPVHRVARAMTLLHRGHNYAHCSKGTLVNAMTREYERFPYTVARVRAEIDRLYP